MPEWLLTLLVGGVIMGLIGVIYKGVLTKAEHAEICLKNMQVVIDVLKNDTREQIQLLKEHLDDKIENVVLKEIRKMNNK